MDKIVHFINCHIAEEGEQFSRQEVIKAIAASIATVIFLAIATAL